MDSNVELLAWTALSLVTGTVGVIWLERSPISDSAVARELLRFARMICIPFVALVRGASGRDVMALGVDIAEGDLVLGFSAGSWITGIGAGIATVCGVLLVMWLSGRSLRDVPTDWLGAGPAALRDAPYQEVHWTFYRAAPALWLGDPMLAVLAGCVLVMIEWLAHPRMGALLGSLDGRQRIALRVVCLLSSGVLYLATRNLWLMITANLAIQLAGGRLLAARPAPRSLSL